jgi:predicted NUDIX family NTP pyrophosphohydrolase
MVRRSAGILLYRLRQGLLQVFLVHPGGPFFKNKDAGYWTIPKGEIEEEKALVAAIREFQEETGMQPEGPFIPLTAVKQKNGKWVDAWAMKGDLDPATLRCNMFTLEWPPKSGRFREFPEVDRGEWFDTDEAMEKINPAQAALIIELKAHIS